MERNKEQHSQGIPSKKCVVDTNTTPSHVVDVMNNPVPLQPKLHNGKIMEQYGLRVPRIFESLEEGLEWLQKMPAGSGHGIIIRSEHPEEGVINARSGILDSVNIRYVMEIESKSPRLYINGAGFFDSAQEVIGYIQGEYLERQINKAILAGYNQKKVSFSIWESINGDNYTVVEDKSNSEHYFIHAGHDAKVRGPVFRRVDLDSASKVDKKLIDEYRKVQQSGKFGKSPIVELQHQFFPIKRGKALTWKEGDVFFLQALQIYDGVQKNFSLDRPEEKDEYPALFVRGATPPEGIEVSLQVQDRDSSVSSVLQYVDDTEGTLFSSLSLSHGDERLECELLFSRSSDKVVMMSVNDTSSMHRYGKCSAYLSETELACIIYDHVGISFIHKPLMSIVLGGGYPMGSVDGVRKVRIISDGQKAYIKTLN